VSLRSAQAGDRYLLCTDGLSAVVPAASIADALPGGTPAEAVQRLLDVAHAHGAPDNVAIVVADVPAV
jgi:protein phosphatase